MTYREVYLPKEDCHSRQSATTQYPQATFYGRLSRPRLHSYFHKTCIVKVIELTATTKNHCVLVIMVKMCIKQNFELKLHMIAKQN